MAKVFEIRAGGTRAWIVIDCRENVVAMEVLEGDMVIDRVDNEGYLRPINITKVGILRPGDKVKIQVERDEDPKLHEFLAHTKGIATVYGVDYDQYLVYIDGYVSGIDIGSVIIQIRGI